MSTLLVQRWDQPWRARNDLGNDPLPLVALLVAGRSPIGLLQVLLKKIEPCLLLPPLDLCLEVHLAIHAPLRWATARLVLALWAGGRGLPLQRSSIAQALEVICPPLLRMRRTMTVLVPSIPWTSTGMTLSGPSSPSSGTSTAWKSRQVYHQLDVRLLLHRSMG